MLIGLTLYVTVLFTLVGTYIWYTDFYKKRPKKTDFSDILNRKRSTYRGGGTPEIQSIKDDLDLQAAVQAWITIRVAKAAFTGEIDYSQYYSLLLEQAMRLNEAQRAVFLVMTLDNEIVNGGFNQYFYNKGTVLAPETVKSLRLIGQNKRADILEKALENYQYVAKGHADAPTAGHLKAQFEAFSKTYQDNPLGELDSEYYKVDDKMWKIMAKYIRSQSNEFKN